jgi:hypothetical protein
MPRHQMMIKLKAVNRIVAGYFLKICLASPIKTTVTAINGKMVKIESTHLNAVPDEPVRSRSV